MTTQKVGREKRHFLNPVPIRPAHDRWIGKFAEPIVGAMSFLKRTLEAPMDPVDHVYSVFHQGVARAGLARDHRRRRHRRLLLGTRVALDLGNRARRYYANPDGRIAADGEVLEMDPGRRVAMAFHPRLVARDRGRGTRPDDLGGRAW